MILRFAFGLPLASALTVLSVCPARADVRKLADLEAEALKSRPELAATRADARAQGAEFDQAAAEFMPHFSLRGEIAAAPGQRLIPLTSTNPNIPGEYYVSGAPPIGGDNTGRAFRPVPRATVELNGSASLYDFGRRSAAGDAAKRAQKASAAAEVATREQLLALVRVRYLGWLAAHEVAAMSAANSRDAKARRERVEQMIQEGVRPKSEFTIARTDELMVLLEQQRADADAENARLILAETVGSGLSADDSPDLSLLDPDASLADHSALDSASAQALDLQEDAKRAQAVAAARASRPDLRVGASIGVRSQLGYNQSGDSQSFKTFPLYAASLGVLVPLWDGGSAAAGAAKARAEADSVRAERDRTKLAQLRESAQAGVDKGAAEARAATALELVGLCKARVADTEAGFQLNAASLEQIADARTALRRAETEHLLARLDRAAARMRMSSVR